MKDVYKCRACDGRWLKTDTSSEYSWKHRQNHGRLGCRFYGYTIKNLVPNIHYRVSSGVIKII